jgi:CBS domain-containing protein
MLSILVKDHMQNNAQAVSVTANVKEVIEHLFKTNMTGVPVIDETEQVVGFVSEQDCIKEMLNSAFFHQEPPSVTQIMHSPVLTVSPDVSVLEVAETMMHNKPKNYPVVSGGKLVGIINRKHILQALVKSDASYYERH